MSCRPTGLNGQYDSKVFISGNRIDEATGAQIIAALLEIHSPGKEIQINTRGRINKALWHFVSNMTDGPWIEHCERLPAPLSTDRWTYSSTNCKDGYEGEDGKHELYKDIIEDFGADFIVKYVRNEEESIVTVLQVLTDVWLAMKKHVGTVRCNDDTNILPYGCTAIDNYKKEEESDEDDGGNNNAKQNDSSIEQEASDRNNGEDNNDGNDDVEPAKKKSKSE